MMRVVYNNNMHEVGKLSSHRGIRVIYIWQGSFDGHGFLRKVWHR